MLKPEGVSVILWFVKRKPTFKTARLKRENVSYGLIRGLLEDILFIYLFIYSFLHHPKALAAVPLVESASLPVQSSDPFFKR